MLDTLKLALMSLVAAALSIMFFFLAAESVSNGYAVVGRHGRIVFTRAESPTAFYVAVCAMCIFAMFMLICSVLLVTSKGASRERRLAYLNRHVFRVGPIVLSLFVISAVLIVAVVSAAFYR
jgi:hypothetical protein